VIDGCFGIGTEGGGLRVAPFAFPVRFRWVCRGVLGVSLLASSLVGTLYAADQAITVSVVVLSKSICKFSSGSASLSFGTLDPGNPVDVTLSTTIGFRCMGSAPVATFLITDDDGMNELLRDGNRMAHLSVPGTYLPYEMTLSPATATVPKSAPQVLTVTGTVRGVDYQGAPAGAYSDSVVISIEP